MLHLLELRVRRPHPLLLGGDRGVEVLQPIREVRAERVHGLLLTVEEGGFVPLGGHPLAQEVLPLRPRERRLRLPLGGAELLGPRPRLHRVDRLLLVHGAQGPVDPLDVADQRACKLEQHLPVEEGCGVPLHLHAALPEDEVQLLRGHVREGFRQGGARDHAVGHLRVKFLLDRLVPHPSPRLPEAEDEVADGLPDGLAGQGRCAHLAVDVQDDGQHHVEHQQHHEDQEGPGPHRRDPVGLR
mmetsp:Transcript_3166/g.8625  ORF Transcript_3166/g.8625 Transcript_3166/m.8625 type:complete len:242 (-) Transcript_3166:1039-1764(-)